MPRQLSRDRRYTLNWVTPGAALLLKVEEMQEGDFRPETGWHSFPMREQHRGDADVSNAGKAGFPGRSGGGSESACNVGDLGLISGSGRSPGEGSGQGLSARVLETASSLQKLLKR